MGISLFCYIFYVYTSSSLNEKAHTVLSSSEKAHAALSSRANAHAPGFATMNFLRGSGMIRLRTCQAIRMSLAAWTFHAEDTCIEARSFQAASGPRRR